MFGVNRSVHVRGCARQVIDVRGFEVAGLRVDPELGVPLEHEKFVIQQRKQLHTHINDVNIHSLIRTTAVTHICE